MFKTATMIEYEKETGRPSLTSSISPEYVSWLENLKERREAPKEFVKTIQYLGKELVVTYEKEESRKTLSGPYRIESVTLIKKVSIGEHEILNFFSQGQKMEICRLVLTNP